MKKILYLLLLMLIGLTGCSEDKAPENLQITQNNYTIGIGEVLYLDTNANSLNIDDVLWESNNKIVATVDNGVVTGINVGAVIITASSYNYIATARVIVEDRSKPTIVIDGKQSLLVGQSINLNLSQSKKVDLSNVQWFSNDENIAIVEAGVVTGVSAGIVKIIAKLSNDQSIFDEYTILVQNEVELVDQIKNTIIRNTNEFSGDFDLTVFSELIISSIDKIGNAFVGVSNYGNINGTLNLQSIGSGIIYNRVDNQHSYTYRLLSNYHVIDKNSEVRVFLGYIDHEITGQVIKYDIDLDLAIIEFESEIEISPVVFSNKPLRNDFVIAIGNPTGYEYFGSVTFGIISHPHRYIEVEDNNVKQKFIQHDAAINSGNSGGPLLNIYGELIGINTLKLVQLSVEGMGFAIPIEVIEDFIN